MTEHKPPSSTSAENVQESWKRFLNPDELKGSLMAASIYIAGFEMLKTSIIERIKDFYTNGFDETGFIVDEAYSTRVLSLDKSPLKASLSWLKESKVITDDDIATFWALRTVRNQLAHELLSFVQKGITADYEKSFSDMSALLKKIEVWWVVNVELDGDPDWADREVDVAGILPGTVMTLDLMTHIAHSPDKDARFYYDEFLKATGQAAEPPPTAG
jgi:hypothetical protein